MPSNPKLSVIITVYNNESLFTRCFDSIRQQFYDNIEIIVVDDGSPGNIKEIMKSLVSTNIKLISHNINRGLYQARITGLEYATGKYIGFIDSDDHISRDFYRTMMCKAVDEDLDIVAGKTIFEAYDGSCFIRNLHEASFGNKVLRGDEVRRAYFGQRGSCFAWHTIWNKIYKKTLWDVCLPHLKMVDNHIIMTEDIAFSSLLFYNANSFGYVINEGYHYCENIDASTNYRMNTPQKYVKNLKDMKSVFDIVENHLLGQKADDEIIDDFTEFRKYYSRMWRSLQEDKYRNTSNYDSTKKMVDEFLPNHYDVRSYEEHYFELFRTKYDSTIEDIKLIIARFDVEVISFDIFDTLVNRPFYKPDDIFILMEARFKEVCANVSIPFSFIRKKSEEDLRARWWIIKPNSQDFTLKDIYNHMQAMFSISKEQAEAMYHHEIDVEINFCKQRKSVKVLYDLAQFLDKRIILISDMYLEESTVLRILEKNGYAGFEKLFLSSKEEKTKYSGDLFKEAIRYLRVSPKKVVHIGDNWNIDFIKSRGMGFTPVFFPKSLESFKGNIQNVITNNCGNLATLICGNMVSDSELEKSMGYRTMISLAANKEFDNPYISFNSESNFNSSPRFMGYYPVGMHLMGICKWVAERALKHKAKKIVFLSRDGYVPIKALNIYSKYVTIPESEYVYCSRRAVMPWMVDRPSDILDLPVNIQSQSPESMYDILEFCSEINADVAEHFTDSTKKGWGGKFSSLTDFVDFVDYFSKNIFSESKLTNSKKIVSKYYKEKIPRGSIVFDMGYSGRIPAAINRALGYNVPFLYIYSDSERSKYYSDIIGTKIEMMYPIYTEMSGFFREYFLSDPDDLCIGFYEKGSESIPMLVKTNRRYIETFALKELQEGALSMVDDFMNLFGNYLKSLNYDSFQVSIPFESFQRKSMEVDKKIFMTSYSDDLVYGGVERINVYNLWKKLQRYVDTDNAGEVVSSNIWNEETEKMSTKNTNLESKDIPYRGISKIYDYIIYFKDRFMTVFGPRLYR